MCLLSIETSGPQWSVALQDKQEVLASSIHPEPQQAASLLIPVIQNLLTEARLSFQDLKGIAVARGPGSFTGIRVGLSTAQGLAFALKCPLFGVRSFEVVYGTLSEKKRRQEKFHVLLDTKGSLLGLCAFPPFPKPPQDPFYGTAAEIAGQLQGEKIVGDGLERLSSLGAHFLEEKGEIFNRAISLGQYVFTQAPDPRLFDLTPLYGPPLSFEVN